MGKNKRKDPVLDAFSRINFLYQASRLIGSKNIDSQLSGYYGSLVREISKKVVEKIHPTMKRSLCQACSSPLLSYKTAVIKIKPNRKSRKKKIIVRGEKVLSTISEYKTECAADEKLPEKYKNPRVDVKKKYPNMLSYHCKTCGYVRTLLQNPNHKLWAEDNIFLIEPGKS